MASVAGVRDIEFLGELGIGNGEAVVVSRVALHVDGDRHVAGDALIAGAISAVVTVCGGVDDRSGGEIRAATDMAIHAYLVAGRDEFVGVRVVAIGAADTGVVHLAG